VGLYLLLILVFVVILQIGIYHSSGPPREREEKEGESFKPLAVKIEETRKATEKMEKTLTAVKVDPEYETSVFIPAGEFIMGNNEGHWMEQPERKVTLSGFFIDKYEVTFAQYYRFVGTGHRKPRLAGYLAVDAEAIPMLMSPFNPVTGVSWDDAVAYCGWMGKRLPTEAEWEKAARGTDKREWPWGNEKSIQKANLEGEADGFRYASPVGSLKEDRSPYGVYDMAGNSMEWVADRFQEDYYRRAPSQNPPGPDAGEERVIRGASWHDALDRARTSVRFKTGPSYRDVTIGFRCAKSRKQ
jgi:formylglycine-generating enzyme required for sulfatase activity